jgi:hypothetical protein
MERFEPGIQHIRVLEQIPFGREKGVGIAAFKGAPMAVVVQRIDIGGADIGVGFAVIVRVEIARLGVLWGGFGLGCQGRLQRQFRCSAQDLAF